MPNVGRDRKWLSNNSRQVMSLAVLQLVNLRNKLWFKQFKRNQMFRRCPNRTRLLGNKLLPGKCSSLFRSSNPSRCLNRCNRSTSKICSVRWRQLHSSTLKCSQCKHNLTTARCSSKLLLKCSSQAACLFKGNQGSSNSSPSKCPSSSSSNHCFTKAWKLKNLLKSLFRIQISLFLKQKGLRLTATTTNWCSSISNSRCSSSSFRLSNTWCSRIQWCNKWCPTSTICSRWCLTCSSSLSRWSSRCLSSRTNPAPTRLRGSSQRSILQRPICALNNQFPPAAATQVSF